MVLITRRAGQAGWPRVIAHPGLPQTRTCRTTAYVLQVNRTARAVRYEYRKRLSITWITSEKKSAPSGQIPEPLWFRCCCRHTPLPIVVHNSVPFLHFVNGGLLLSRMTNLRAQPTKRHRHGESRQQKQRPNHTR